MSGAVAVGALLIVIELGAPVASNLGLSAGLPTAGHGGTAAQALQDPSFTDPGQGATSVASATASAPVTPAPAPATPAPTTTQTVAYVASLQPSSVTPSRSGAAGTSVTPVSGPIVAAASSPSTTGNDGAHAVGHVSSQTGGSSAQVSSYVSISSDPHSGASQHGLGGGQGGGDQQGQGNGHGGDAAQGQGNGGSQGQGNGGPHGKGDNGHGAGSD